MALTGSPSFQRLAKSLGSNLARGRFWGRGMLASPGCSYSSSRYLAAEPGSSERRRHAVELLGGGAACQSD